MQILRLEEWASAILSLIQRPGEKCRGESRNTAPIAFPIGRCGFTFHQELQGILGSVVGLRLSIFDSRLGLFSAFSAALRENGFIPVLAVVGGGFASHAEVRAGLAFRERREMLLKEAEGRFEAGRIAQRCRLSRT